MTKLITPEFRGSFVSLLEPRSIPGSDTSKPKYQITIVLPKDDKFWTQLKTVIKTTAEAKWGKIPPKLKNPIKDGDEEGRDEFADRLMVQASSIQKPGIVDTNLNPVMDADEIYSGAWYRATVRCFAWDHPTGGKGVSVALDNVMKVKDDESFSGRAKAEDDFADFAQSKSNESGLLD